MSFFPSLFNGNFSIGSYKFTWAIRKVYKPILKSSPKLVSGKDSVKLHIGPGSGWEKPDPAWLTIDIDPLRGDIVLDFSDFEKLPLEDESVTCVYGSHVFEHMSIYVTPKVFSEIWRVLADGGYFRLVLPDARKSIEKYLESDCDFPLFQRRTNRAKELHGIQYTLFECMKEDFLSRSGQVNLLGRNSLAHQNAWDFDAIKADLCRAGFEAGKIKNLSFKDTFCEDFRFEGSFPSEANEYDRSIYIEVRK